MEPTITWKESKTIFEEDTRDTKFFITLIFYGEGQALKIYKNLSREKCENRFITMMNSRTEFEIKEEGWKGYAIEIPFDVDEILLCDISGQLNRMVAGLFGVAV